MAKRTSKKATRRKARSLTIGQSFIALRHVPTLLRGGLLSNDHEVVSQTQAIISNYLELYPAVASLNRWETAIKPWVHNKVKTRRHIKDTRANAQLDVVFNPTDFTARWVLALAQKYCREFQNCLDSFEAAEKLAAPDKDKRDFYADWAEFYVYIGETSKALDKLQASNAAEDWHPWVHAFALHQHAFASAYPGNPDPQYYSDSNDLLQAWDPTGTMPDAKLIEAANYAGLNNLPKARTALAAFLAANPKWSMAKEKRGPFIKRLPLDDDPAAGTTEGKAKKKYRRLYAKHFFDNLRAARASANDLKESENDDGELVDDSDAEAD